MSNRSKQKIKPIRVSGSVDKESILTRDNLAQVVGTNAPNSAVWKATPEIQVAGQNLVAAGAALAAADATVQSIQAQLDTAIHARDAKLAEFDAAHAVYVANVEARATTPEDVTGLGLTLLAKSSHPLAAPLGVEARVDPVNGQVHVRVKRARGMRATIVEVSSNPVGPDTWQRLLGMGALHKLRGYVPGTYWVRAASVRANAISDFTAPVAVIVK
jgi:hypothetical protein